MSPDTNFQATEEALAIRAALDALGLEGYELDKQAHISLATLESLAAATIVGDPRTWMQNNYNNLSALPEETIHPELLKILKEVEEISEGEVGEHIERITALANSSDPEFENASDNPESRRRYQNHERFLMNLVIEATRDEILEIPKDQTLLWIVLRGAKFHQQVFEEFASSVVENESKRLKLNNGEFAMGHRMITYPENVNRSNIQQIIIPDDCLSTGMSQAENIKMIFGMGFRPERIVVPVTVATTDGFNYLKDLEREILMQYGDELPEGFSILIAPAASCEFVDENMYLEAPDGRALVGDMGDWNRDVEGDTESDSNEELAEL